MGRTSAGGAQALGGATPAVRALGPGDLPGVLALAGATFPEAEVRRMARALENGRRGLVATDDEGAGVGFLVGGAGTGLWLGVAKGWEDRGTAAALLREDTPGAGPG